MLFLRLAALLPLVAGFVTPEPPLKTINRATSSSLEATASDAISALSACQTDCVNKIATAIPDLASKPDFTWNADSGIEVGGSSVTLDARDAPGPANVAWLSALTVDAKLCSLTIFNGPLTDVPHLISRCSINDDGTSMQFTLDFRPRAYGAYELRREDGTYPGPDELGRKSFEYSGARADFDKKFGTEEVQAWLSKTVGKLDGATSHDPDAIELDKLTRGPLFTSLSMPVNDGNVATIAAAWEQVVEYWLSWVQDDGNEHRPGAPVNTQYVYDTKFKQNAYGALLNEFKIKYGEDDGTKLAVGDSGPLDEAYVGGAS